MLGAKKIACFTADDYYALPEGKSCELINGAIFNTAPSPLRIHQKISGEIFVEISNYIKKNKGTCEIYSAPFDVQLSDNDVVVPDISVICDKSKLTERGCSGAPDWIIEIVSSNAVHDYVFKLNLYQVYGVREYWIVDPKSSKVTVYNFCNEFSMKTYDFSETIPVAIYNDDLKINISDLL